MDDHFGKIKVNRLSEAWAEATLIWPGDLKVQGEDESLIINYIIVWRHMPLITEDRDLLIWAHVSKNMDTVIKKFLMLNTNCFALQNVRYFATCLLMLVMDKIWQSNINITIIRQYGPVLMKAAADIENHFHGGFRNVFLFFVLYILYILYLI